MSHQLGGDLQIGLGVLSWLDIGLTLPMSLTQMGRMPVLDVLETSSGRELSGFAMGDLPDPRTSSNCSSNSRLEIDLALFISGGSYRECRSFERRRRCEWRCDGDFGAFAHLLGRHTLRWALEAGYRYHPETDLLGMKIGHEVLYNGALSVEIILIASRRSSNRRCGRAFRRRCFGSIASWCAARCAILSIEGHRLGISLGVGIGIIGGYGSPRFRGFLGIVWAPWSVGDEFQTAMVMA